MPSLFEPTTTKTAIIPCRGRGHFALRAPADRTRDVIRVTATGGTPERPVDMTDQMRVSVPNEKIAARQCVVCTVENPTAQPVRVTVEFPPELASPKARANPQGK